MVLMGGCANNPRAIRFYEKNGFRKWAIQHPQACGITI
jgi:hypothetical protein